MPTETERAAQLQRQVAQLEHQLAQLVQLADREAIRDCILRYCRGIDRCDEAALRSAYWPDATDRHGPYQGSASGFIDWAMDKLSQGGRNVHMVGNIAIELRGDVAACETYFHALQAERTPGAPARDLLLCGRYIDRFERRGGEWRVASRVVAYDWMQSLPVEPGTQAERFGVRQPIGAPKPADPWYALLASLPAA